MTVERVIGIEPTTTTLATLCSTTELHPLGFCRSTPLHNGRPGHGSIEKLHRNRALEVREEPLGPVRPL